MIGLSACVPPTPSPGGGASGGPRTQAADPQTIEKWAMPDEGMSHQATWMAYGITEKIWTKELADPVRRTLVDIANAISSFDPVRMLVPPGVEKPKVAPGVELVEHRTDDLWIRDTGPVFVRDDQGALAGVNLNFNGWGDKQEHVDDATVASVVTALAGVPEVSTDLVIEGGGLEVDGEGTAILTESCVLNDNRNPGWSRADVEEELGRLFGIEKVIWLPGIVGQDITDGHTDFYARFTSPGVVVAARDDDPDSFDHAVTRTHLDILRTCTDARGRALTIRELPAPARERLRSECLHDDFAAGYINFALCNGGVIAPQFGDSDADEYARRTLGELFPGRTVVQLNIDPLAAGGGGIHCATQQQPR